MPSCLFDVDNTLAGRDRALRGWARWFAREHLSLVQDHAIDEAVTGLIGLDGDGRTPKDLMFSTSASTG